MVHAGDFTPLAIAINFLGGALFLVAASRFMFDFYHSQKTETCLFAYLALLFGVSGVTFTQSTLWDPSWWQWHLLRLVAYLLVLGVLFRGYYLMQRELRTTNEQLELDIIERKQVEEVLSRKMLGQGTIASILNLALQPISLEETLRRSLVLVLQRQGID